ncbi:unnamed protein product, partial [Rotaria sp. Silwood2]
MTSTNEGGLTSDRVR